MHADSGIKIKVLRVDGGMTANNLVMQFQSDLLDIPLHRPEISETTSLGAAFAAGKILPVTYPSYLIYDITICCRFGRWILGLN